ncbi:Ecdysone-induced protein 28/29kD [Operophtera brumata]|uniref:peptide-methionine (S)-S-oxide reductase n=1 Tax=Operophtera brumata TaxID=104452 RepID=A0A0L7LBI5_OPEBR|nr:Ecdysone-induced protein 28/29kD [Operophtera brumata]
MGCFWSNDSLFGATPGVVRTRVGYSGGTTKNPAYRNLGDHTEVIELDFDPKTVTYEDLLDMFWANHEYGLTTKLKRQRRRRRRTAPRRCAATTTCALRSRPPAPSTPRKIYKQSLILYHDAEQRAAAEASHRATQVRCNDNLRTEIAPAGTFYPAEEKQSLILYHDAEQRAAAEASHRATQVRCNDNLRTEIAPAGTFYPAEDYHQKYRLQGHKDLCRSLGLDSSKLQTSHLAARLNGYLVGVGGMNMFEQEVEKLGLSEKQAEYVRREIERNEGGGLAC